MRAAAEAHYAAGQGDQAAVIKALGEETAVDIQAVRLQGDRAAARELLNALLARPASAPLAEPSRLRRVPAANLVTASLMERARGGSPALTASGAEVDAARTRTALAEKAWYPDLMLASDDHKWQIKALAREIFQLKAAGGRVVMSRCSMSSAC
jgi:outer membrane protein TolC